MGKRVDLEILFEDEELIVINKPAGLLSIPDRFVPEKPNLQHLLTETYGKIWTIHRLDRETSGVICFARTEGAHRSLSLQFENRTVTKIYTVLVDGRLPAEMGEISKGIAPHPSRSGKMIATNKGKKALTLYRVKEYFKAFTLVEADIKTGRTHQIRVHFQAIGHPLAIDPLYGKREAFLLSEVKGRKYQLGRDQEEKPLMSRMCLHASHLEVDHPVSGERLTFAAPFPKDFGALLKQLRKWGN